MCMVEKQRYVGVAPLSPLPRRCARHRSWVPSAVSYRTRLMFWQNWPLFCFYPDSPSPSGSNARGKLRSCRKTCAERAVCRHTVAAGQVYCVPLHRDSRVSTTPALHLNQRGWCTHPMILLIVFRCHGRIPFFLPVFDCCLSFLPYSVLIRRSTSHRYTRTGWDTSVRRRLPGHRLPLRRGQGTLPPSVFRSEPAGAFAEWSA